MNNQDTLSQKAVLLWLSGVRLKDLQTLPEVEALRQQGVRVDLDPSPITGPLAQHFQALSGRSPASFGFFDALMPHNYHVVESTTGRGEVPKLLPDMLRGAGWQVKFEETPPSNLVVSMEQWVQNASAEKSCLIVKCGIDDAMNVPVPLPAVAQAIVCARAWVGEDGLFALFSDWQPVRVERFVNLNNFLAEMGVIELEEQGQSVNWSNSLAYFAGHGQLWLNLLGRDAQGAVHPQDEAEEVRETLVKALPARLRDPHTQKPVIERVYRKEEVYSGEYLFCAPDLVVLFAPGYAPSPSSTHVAFDQETLFAPGANEYANAGVHPSLVGGFLLASAPGLARSVAVAEHAPLTALVPSLLHALGVEYAGVEGTVVTSLFSPAYLERHPIRSNAGDQGLSEEEEELIINRLRDLGYL